MDSFVGESSPLIRDQINSVTPSLNSYRSSLYSHQRSYSNNLTYTTLPQPVLASKFSEKPSILSSFSTLQSKRDDIETKPFQVPCSIFAKPNINTNEKSQEENSPEKPLKNRSQTRTTRIYTMEDIKAELNLYQKSSTLNSPNQNSSSNIINNNNNNCNAFNNQSEQTDIQNQSNSVDTITQETNNNISETSTKENQPEVQHNSTSSNASPSPLLLKFGNMDLRKRASILPIKPVEIDFDNQLQTKLGSKFRNLKIDDAKLEGKNDCKSNVNEDNDDDSDLSDSSPIDQKAKMRKNLISSFEEFMKKREKDEDEMVNNDSDENEDNEDNDEDETQENTEIGSISENLIVEVKCTNNCLLKSILKKPLLSARTPNHFNAGQTVNIGGNAENTQTNYRASPVAAAVDALKKQTPLTTHQRSNSLNTLPSSFSSNIYSDFAFSNQFKQQQSPIVHNTPTNLNSYLPASSCYSSFSTAANTATTSISTPNNNSNINNNILSNRDLNSQSHYASSTSASSKDYQFTSVVTPFLEKPNQAALPSQFSLQSANPQPQMGRPFMKRSQSLTGAIKRVQFMIQNEGNSNAQPSLQSPQTVPNYLSSFSQPNISGVASSGSSFQKTNILPFCYPQRGGGVNKGNQFSKFYSAFKQNLKNSKQSEIFSSPQVKQTLNGNQCNNFFNRNENLNLNQNYNSSSSYSNNNSANHNHHNSSINSTASTIPSLTSFSNYCTVQAIQNIKNLQQHQTTTTTTATTTTTTSNSSSELSTPLASQSSISNMISPLPASINFERKNPISQNLLNSVFKDMKLTKNTKVYLEQKTNSPCFSSMSPSKKVNSASSINSPVSNSCSQRQSEYIPMRRSPSTDIVFRTFNA